MIKAFFAALFAYVTYWFSPKQVAKREKEAADTAADQIEDDVHTGDEDAVNRRLHDTLRCAWLTVALMALWLATMAMVVGCVQQRTVYVNEPDRVYRMERNGVSGWWVPDGRMTQMLQKLDEGKRK